MSLEKDIIDLVKDNFNIDDVFDKEAIISYVYKNYDPDDIFSKTELKYWAEDNDFVNLSDLENLGYLHMDQLSEKGYIHIDEINKLMFESK